MAILSKQNETYLLAGAALVVGYLGYRAWRLTVGLGEAISEGAGNALDAGVDFVTEDLNPTSEYNLVNQTIGQPVNDAVASVTGHGLGGTIFCLFNSDAPACNPGLFSYATRRNLPYFGDDGKSINPDTLSAFEAWQTSTDELML